MKTHDYCKKRKSLAIAVAALACATSPILAHIIPPEDLHPVAEAYRRVNFILNLNPVVWDQVRGDVQALSEYWSPLDAKAAEAFHTRVNEVISAATVEPDEEK